jgi:hypothetical protein
MLNKMFFAGTQNTRQKGDGYETVWRDEVAIKQASAFKGRLI